MPTNYKIYCPIDGDPYDNEFTFKRYTSAISEIISFSQQIAFIDIEGEKFKPIIYRSNHQFTKSLRLTGLHPCLVFEIDLPAVFNTYNGKREIHPYKNDTRVLFQSFQFVAMCQIAYPQSIGKETLEMMINDSLYFLSVDVGNFIYDPSEILSLEWPSFRKINVKQIYEWMERKNISFQNFSKGAAHRALIACTNISRSNYYSIEHHLMWSMYGIEAIYTKGNDRILRQINERTQLILGKVTGLKNAVKKLYDWRSKFAHGKLNLLMVYSEANRLEPKQNNFYNDASHQIKLAICILIASIQELVLQDRTEFDFPPIMSRWERIKSMFDRYLKK